jgi:hypothetical protein
MNPPSEYMKQRYNEARQNLTKAVQFAYDNVTKPKDKQTLERMLAYLKMEPGEASPEEIKFFNQQLDAFKKRGIIQDSVLIELRRRENMNQAMESAASASARVVSLRPTVAGTQLTEQLHVAGDALQEPDEKDKL